jgi:hypothetical protein
VSPADAGAHSRLDSNGSAIVIHTGKDDDTTVPAGDSDCAIWPTRSPLSPLIAVGKRPHHC